MSESINYAAFKDPDLAHTRQCNHENNMAHNALGNERIIALESAVATVGQSGNANVVVAAANVFLAFLSGDEGVLVQ